jgi:hypothetical protein
VVGWLLEHQVLVPATEAFVVLPGDAGLDIKRLVLLVGLTVLLTAMLTSRRRRDKAPPQDEPGTGLGDDAPERPGRSSGRPARPGKWSCGRPPAAGHPAFAARDRRTGRVLNWASGQWGR